MIDAITPEHIARPSEELMRSIVARQNLRYRLGGWQHSASQGKGRTGYATALPIGSHQDRHHPRVLCRPYGRNVACPPVRRCRGSSTVCSHPPPLAPRTTSCVPPAPAGKDRSRGVEPRRGDAVSRCGAWTKYKAAFSAAYGAGLRVSEVVALKVSDVDSKRMLLRIEQGKGRKDRFAMLSSQLLELLRDWCSSPCPLSRARAWPWKLERIRACSTDALPVPDSFYWSVWREPRSPRLRYKASISAPASRRFRHSD